MLLLSLSAPYSSVDLVLAADLISDEYRSGPHRASLFAHVVNVDCGDAHERLMTSGKHTIRNIYCVSCATELGWTYVAAENSENQYKIGKFILIQPFVRKHERTPANPVGATSEHQQGVDSPRSQSQGELGARSARSLRERSGSLPSSTLSPTSAAAASAFARSASSSRRSSFGHVNIISSRVSSPISPLSPRSPGGAPSSSSSSSASDNEINVARDFTNSARLLRRALADEGRLHRTLQSMGETVAAIEQVRQRARAANNMEANSPSIGATQALSPPSIPAPNSSPVAPNVPPTAGQRRIS